MSRRVCGIVLVVAVVLVLVAVTDARRRKKNYHKSMILRQKETNAIDFIRLAVMRLIYGIATRMGFGEQISEALNGAFVPPGAEEYSDYDGFDLLDDRTDDYDY